MIEEGKIVKGSSNNASNSPTQIISGVITKSKRHYCDKNHVEIVLAEVLFQAEGFNRAIYAYTGEEFHIIKDCPAAPSNLEFA